MFVRAGRLGIRRRSTFALLPQDQNSPSNSARDLKSEARTASNSLSTSVIRPRSYTVRSPRRRRIGYSVHIGPR
jgi:hypothetical protein